MNKTPLTLVSFPSANQCSKAASVRVTLADPARNIGLMVCYSSGGDIFNEPHAAELIDCYMNPTLEVKP